MPTGSTSDFEQSRDEIITDALTNLGVLGPGKDASGVKRDHAARALNRLVKAIDAEGSFLWRTVRRTTTTTSGTATFTTASDVLEIDQPLSYKRAAVNTRTTLQAMSRDDFMNLSDRTTTGLPTQYLVERTLSTFTVTLWPVPDATGDTIEYAALVRSLDFDTGANTPDFFPKWTACLVYGLTSELAPGYGQMEQASYYRSLYRAELDKLINDDGERGDIQFVPFGGF